MNLSTFGYWLIESLEGIKKNSKTFLIGLGTMIAVLCIISALYILRMNANSFMGDVKDDESKVNIYIENLTQDQVTIALEELYLIEGIKDVNYIDEKQAFAQAKERMPRIIDGYTPEDNVVPASFVITIDGAKNGNVNPIEQSIKNIEVLQGNIKGMDGFEEAGKTIKIAKTVEVVTMTVLILVVVVGCFLMMNSIKLVLYARRKEISIMKYVGATDRFTRAPFIIEGLIISLIAAVVTLFIVNITYSGLENLAQNTPMLSFVVSKEKVFSSLAMLLFGVGIGIGTIGSAMSINKYLDV